MDIFYLHCSRKKLPEKESSLLRVLVKFQDGATAKVLSDHSKNLIQMTEVYILASRLEKRGLVGLVNSSASFVDGSTVSRIIFTATELGRTACKEAEDKI
jgi:hypothetical protein